jgi:hypothetical protein
MGEPLYRLRKMARFGYGAFLDADILQVAYLAKLKAAFLSMLSFASTCWSQAKGRVCE